MALEVALRMDVGVYALEFAEIERGFRRYGSARDPPTQRLVSQPQGGK